MGHRKGTGGKGAWGSEMPTKEGDTSTEGLGETLAREGGGRACPLG